MIKDIETAISLINTSPCLHMSKYELLDTMIVNYILEYADRPLYCYDRSSLVFEAREYVLKILKDSYPELTEEVVATYLLEYINGFLPSKMNIKRGKDYIKELQNFYPYYREVMKTSSTSKQCLYEYDAKEPRFAPHCTPCGASDKKGNIPIPIEDDQDSVANIIVDSSLS